VSAVKKANRNFSFSWLIWFQDNVITRNHVKLLIDFDFTD